MNILVVEDLPRWQKIIKDALEFDLPWLVESLSKRGITLPASHSINVVDNQYSAREIIEAQKEPFDLVILDLLIKKLPGGDVDPRDGLLLGYQLVSDVRLKFGDDVPIVVYSEYLGSGQDERIAQHGLFEFLSMLRERNVAPPDEMLWKALYGTPSLLMTKLVRYAIDLTADDVDRLEREDILVPKRGATRRVLRELKRMACSASIGFPRSDVLLLGENGVGKTTFARAYHLLRPRYPDQPQLGFHHLDLGSLDVAGSAPNIALFGASDFNGAWSLGAFVRTTLYKRSHELVVFLGQDWEHRPVSTKAVPALSTNYPESSDQVDYDGSGTLFLDEVVNIGPDIQAMLLQALSYNLHSRHVYTTGHAPRRLRVGPSLVFATAQKLEWDSAGPSMRGDELGGERHFSTMKDYLFRIDQMRVTIPPLRERESEEVKELLIALVNKRRPQDPTAKHHIEIDPVVELLLADKLIFRNNVADLQRIADQVMPEETTITWQHVGPLFERERPLIPEIHAQPTVQVSQQQAYMKAQEKYDEYLREYVSGDRKFPVSHLPRKLDISQKEAYNVALIFMDACNCGATKRWPPDEKTERVFGHNSKTFKTYLHRLWKYRNGPFNLADALRDLAILKGFPAKLSDDSADTAV